MATTMPVPNRLHLTGWERAWYILGNIITLGLPYWLKINRKVALIEVLNQQQAAHIYNDFMARQVQQPPQPPAGVIES